MAVLSACLHLGSEILKEQVRITDTNSMRKVMWMCLGKWARSSVFSACFSEPKPLNRCLCKPGSSWLNFSVWGYGNLKPQLKISCASGMYSPSPNYIISLKSINDLFACLFLSLHFSFSSSSCISSSFFTLLYLSDHKVFKGDILNIIDDIYSHPSHGNWQHSGFTECDPKSRWSQQVDFF